MPGQAPVTTAIIPTGPSLAVMKAASQPMAVFWFRDKCWIPAYGSKACMLSAMENDIEDEMGPRRSFMRIQTCVSYPSSGVLTIRYIKNSRGEAICVWAQGGR